MTLSCRAALLLSIAFIAGCGTPQVAKVAQTELGACVATEVPEHQHASAEYDRTHDLTHIRSAVPVALGLDLATILDAQEEPAEEPISELPVGTPTLQAEIRCPGRGVCTPDTVSLIVARTAVLPVFSGVGEVTFRLDGGAVAGFPVVHHSLQVGEKPGPHYVMETVEVEVSYRDFLTIACDAGATFRYKDLEGTPEIELLRSVVQTVDRREPVREKPGSARQAFLLGSARATEG